jgi:transposase
MKEEEVTYPLAFRRKVMSIKAKEGLTFAETAKRFGVGIASITRWSQKLEPQTTRYKPPVKLNMEGLKKDIEQYPDAYQYERASRLGVTAQGIWHAMRRLNITVKKNTHAPQGNTRRSVYLLLQD